MRNDNRHWVIARRPSGDLTTGDLEFRQGPRPVAGKGQIVVRNEWLSLDPTNRLWMQEADTYLPAIPLGQPMRGFVVGKVVDHGDQENFAIGSYVMGIGSWSDYSCGPVANFFPMFDVANASPKDLLGYYYHIAPTAYFGLLDIGQPKIGETLVVSTAAGAVGSIAAQLGKVWGCRVIGIAGGKEKCDWLINDLGLDGAIDYKSEKLSDRLRALCPNGVDVFFDNVGGQMLNMVLNQVNIKGRVVLCGGISAYGKNGRDDTPGNYLRLIVQRIRAEGFVVLDYLARYPEALRAIATLHGEGRLKWRYHDVDSLEDAEAACIDLYAGRNHGKVMVKIADA